MHIQPGINYKKLFRRFKTIPISLSLDTGLVGNFPPYFFLNFHYIVLQDENNYMYLFSNQRSRGYGYWAEALSFIKAPNFKKLGI